MCFGSKPKATSDFNNSQGQTPNTGIVDSSPRNSSSKMPTNESYSPLSGPPPAHAYAPAAGPPPSQSYAPPSGPPPGRFVSNNPFAASAPSQEHHFAPQGPSPSQRPAQTEYESPQGPPPFYSPPEGAPDNQQPQHDWQTAVPDNSLLPPPPALFTGHDRSRTNNANEQEAEQGEAWCHYNLMLPPLYYPLEAVAAINHGEIGVVTPRGYKGTLESQRPGIWKGKTKSNSPDSCITSSIPLYSVAAHSPLNSGQPKTVYYEMRIARGNRGQVSLAMGYTAPPYPTFRLPGWHRGSLAVHGDDGSKYINDRWGGKDFTTPFRAGETLGLGMTFTRRDVDEPPTYGSAPQPTESRLIDVEIFLTRNGQKTGEWNLHEEGDAEQDLPVIGLEGLNDIFAAVGTFEAVEFEIIFNQSEWMFRP